MTPIDRYESERAIGEVLARVGRECMTQEERAAFVARYGQPWWLELRAGVWEVVE